jgi:hypothetical protein
MQTLGLTLLKINDWVLERLPVSLTTPIYPYKPGAVVWVKEWTVHLLKPHWRGSFVVFLSIPAVKVAKIAPWIHHSQVKPASPEQECVPDPASPCKITLWNTCTLPWQDPASWEAAGDHKKQDDSPALVTLEAD